MLAHRLAYTLLGVELPEQVDHINGDKTCNAWHNLRDATQSQNQHNAKKRADNTSGVKGLAYLRSRHMWVGQLWVNGVRKSKSNKNREVVEQWLRDTREALHKEFHNHG